MLSQYVILKCIIENERMRVLTVGAQKTSNSSKNRHARLIDRRCEYECTWLSVSLCQPCSRLTNCPGCTLPPAPWSLGYAPEPPTTLNFISRRKWIGVGFFSASEERKDGKKNNNPASHRVRVKLEVILIIFIFICFYSSCSIWKLLMRTTHMKNK